jgi:hypothetical protein
MAKTEVSMNRYAARLLALAALLTLALALSGNTTPQCQPVAPDEPLCLTAYDCEGLVPDVDCVGAWACEEAACVFHCGSENPNCVKEGEGFTEFNPADDICCGDAQAVSLLEPMSDGTCAAVKCPCYVCIDCGDGICGPGEDFCMCPEDCEAPGCPTPQGYVDVDVDDLTTQADTYADMDVAFETEVGVGYAMCTLMACGPANPCCNSCGASFRAGGPQGFEITNGGAITNVGCSGNECTYMDNCTPLVDGLNYKLWGRWVVSYGYGHLELDGYCPL